MLSHLLQNPSEVRRLLAGRTATLSQLENRRVDLTTVLAEASGSFRTFLRQHIGEVVMDQVVSSSHSWTVSRQQAEELWDLVNSRLRVPGLLPGSGSLIGTDAALLQIKSGTGLGRIMESDHVIEQRITRMLMDGLAVIERRQPGFAFPRRQDQIIAELRAGGSYSPNCERMSESLAILAPANHIVASRLAILMPAVSGRPSAMPWYYVHQGLASKSSRMRDLIPWRLEGYYGLQEILDATVWVLCHEFPMRQLSSEHLGLALTTDFAQLIRADMIDTLIDSIDAHGTPMIRALQLPTRITSADSRGLREALESRLHLPALTAERFSANAWRTLTPITGPLDEAAETAEELKRVAESIAAARAAATGGRGTGQ
jgi:hypothetical protein